MCISVQAFFREVQVYVHKNFLTPSFYLIIGKYISCFCVTWAAVSYHVLLWNKALH